MIEGLKFRMTAVELRDHLYARIEHHKKRVDFYKAKADELAAGQAEGMGYSNGDPVRNLREKATEHGAKIELFTWMRNHVAESEEYQLADADLLRLEILTRQY